MKKLLLIACIGLNLMAEKQVLVDIEPAKVFYINFENQACNDKCLEDLLQKGLYISYIARFNSDDERLNNIYAKLINGIDYIDLNHKLETSTTNDIKIALLIPEKVIKSYAANIISPTLAYLSAQKQNVYMKVYFTHDEDESNIEPIISKLYGYSFIITGYQNNGIKVLSNNITNIPVFNPLAKSNNFPNISSNYTFGSIDYKEQVLKLLDMANGKVAIFKDDSVLANEISNIVSEESNVVYEKTLGHKNLNINSVLNDGYRLNSSSVFFNLPLIKTTLLSTQMRALGVRPSVYLSTQINYHPMFLNLSQDNERSMFYFANSIGDIDSEIEYINDILGQKIAYNWVAYSTSVGLDYYYNKLQNNEKSRIFKDDFVGNSLQFNVRIMNAKKSKFTEEQ